MCRIASGNYSCLVASFFLSRSVGFHLVQSYLPTILIVVISWVSFWMDVDSVPGRTTLGVTTLLAVSSQSSGRYFQIYSTLEKLSTPNTSGELQMVVDQGSVRLWSIVHQ